MEWFRKISQFFLPQSSPSSLLHIYIHTQIHNDNFHFSYIFSFCGFQNGNIHKERTKERSSLNSLYILHRYLHTLSLYSLMIFHIFFLFFADHHHYNLYIRTQYFIRVLQLHTVHAMIIYGKSKRIERKIVMFVTIMIIIF